MGVVQCRILQETKELLLAHLLQGSRLQRRDRSHGEWVRMQRKMQRGNLFFWEIEPGQFFVCNGLRSDRCSSKVSLGRGTSSRGGADIIMIPGRVRVRVTMMICQA